MSFRGGAYGDVHHHAQQLQPPHQLPDGTRIECHHLIPKRVLELLGLGLDTDEGPAVQLTASDHRHTETYGFWPRSVEARGALLQTIRAGRLDVALERARAEVEAMGPDYAEALAEAFDHVQRWLPLVEEQVEAVRTAGRTALEEARRDVEAAPALAPAEAQDLRRARDAGATLTSDETRQLRRFELDKLDPQTMVRDAGLLESGSDLGRQALGLRSMFVDDAALAERTVALGQLSRYGESGQLREVSLVAACRGGWESDQQQALEKVGYRLVDVGEDEGAADALMRHAAGGEYVIDALGSGDGFDEVTRERLASAMGGADVAATPERDHVIQLTSLRADTLLALSDHGWEEVGPAAHEHGAPSEAGEAASAVDEVGRPDEASSEVEPAADEFDAPDEMEAAVDELDVPLNEIDDDFGLI